MDASGNWRSADWALAPERAGTNPVPFCRLGGQGIGT